MIPSPAAELSVSLCELSDPAARGHFKARKKYYFCPFPPVYNDLSLILSLIE